MPPPVDMKTSANNAGHHHAAHPFVSLTPFHTASSSHGSAA